MSNTKKNIKPDAISGTIIREIKPGESLFSRKNPVPSLIQQDGMSLPGAILDALNEHVVISDLDMKILWCNMSASESIGLSHDEIIGRKCHTLWGQSEKPCHDCPVQNAVKTGRPHSTEKTTPDGKSWLISGYPLRDASGKITGGIEITLDTTEFKNAELLYKKEHEFLNIALLAADDGLWDYNMSENRGMFSTSFYTMLGYEPGEVEPTFTLWRNSIHPDDRMRVFQEMNSLKKDSKNMMQTELRFRTRQGEWKWTIMRAIVTEWNEQGNPDRLIGSNIDIQRIKTAEDTIAQKNAELEKLISELTKTNEELESLFRESHSTNEVLESINLELTTTQSELLAAGEELRRSEEFFRQIADNFPAPLCIVNNEGAFEYFNPRFEKTFGYSRNDFHDVESWFRLGYPDRDYREKVMADWLLEINDTSNPTTIGKQFSITCRDGSVKLIQFTRISLENRKQYLIMEDITERNLAEEILRENEEKYRSLVESMKEVMYLLDPEGHIQYISPSVYELNGYTPEELNGRHFTCLIHPEDLDRLKKRFSRLLSGEYEPLEYRLLHKNKMTVYVKSSSRLIIQEGTVTGINGLLSDITLQKLAEEERIRLEKKLMESQKLEAIGTLAGGIAHDFNNILTAIIGYTELSMRKCDDDSDIFKHLQHIMTGSKRASELVQQMLTFSRGTRSCKSLIEISPVIREVLKLLNSSLPPGISIVQNIEKETSPVLADPTQIHQLIMNLCTNAIHAMKDTGGTLTVEFRETGIDKGAASDQKFSAPGNYLLLKVSDTGHGIDNAIINRIFEPFFTTKNVGEGTGMGLSVVHGIVNNLDGDIIVSSSPGSGSEFTVYLPFPGVGNSEESTGSTTRAKTACILLLAPESGVDCIYPGLLEGYGYHVVTVNNTVTSLEAIISNPGRFDLVIMDTAVSDLNTAVLAAEIKKFRADIPVIVCTNEHDRALPGEADRNIIDAFIDKPVQRHEYKKIIRDMLEKTGDRRT